MLLEVICVCGQVVACAPLLEPEASIGQRPCVYSVEATWSKRPLLPEGLTSVEATLDVTSLTRGSVAQSAGRHWVHSLLSPNYQGQNETAGASACEDTANLRSEAKSGEQQRAASLALRCSNQ